MTDAEIVEVAARLGCSVIMVDDRPIPPSVRHTALRTQAAAFVGALNAHARRPIATVILEPRGTDPVVGIGSLLSKPWTVAELRSRLLASHSARAWAHELIGASWNRR